MDNAVNAVNSLFAKKDTPAQSEEKATSTAKATSHTKVAATSKPTTRSSAAKDVDTAVDQEVTEHKPIKKQKKNDSTAATIGQEVEETTVDQEVAAPVEHTHIRKEHETVEQKFVEKEKHQDHYHTTIQPLKDTEVVPEKHDQVQETEYQEINKDTGAAEKKAKADRSGFESTSEEKQFESKTKEETKETEHVHHHLHETIQPVIEKGMFGA